ncbi:MAG: hypothetical protein MZV49_11375 [Rhodopseudomonas palustris]|nr:hypothetical protein [Rhodopseudomonas palustris]
MCAKFAESYKKGAESSGAECKLVYLIDLQFDPILHFGYRKRTELEPDLVQVQKIFSMQTIWYLYIQHGGALILHY